MDAIVELIRKYISEREDMRERAAVFGQVGTWAFADMMQTQATALLRLTSRNGAPLTIPELEALHELTGVALGQMRIEELKR